MKLLGLVIVIFICVQWVDGSHFRGGTISWNHVNSYGSNTHEVELEYRLGWRNTYFGGGCDDTAIANQTPGYDLGSWNVDGSSVGSYSLHSTEIICTVFSPREDWMYGYYSFVSNITSSTPFNIRFTGCCWIGGLHFGGGSSWSIGLQNADFRIRSDTGKPNASPVTFSPPVVRLQRGCQSTIIITSTDEDYDTVTCRYAIGGECDGICGSYEYFTLDEQNCIIRYDGGGDANLVPVAIMLEDHPRQAVTLGGSETVTISDHFSAIPLQFLVDVSYSVYSNQSCNVLPSFPEYAVANGAKVAVSRTGTFNETLYAYPSVSGIRIERFIIIGPLGMQHTPVYDLGGDLYATDLTWTPSNDQKGDHNLCYYAVDGHGKNSNQRCLTIAVASTSNTCDLENGGCSDECIPVGPSNICSCSHPCWVLAGDRKTCVPEMNVTCNTDNIDIKVTRCATDKTIVAGGDREYFSTTSCQSVERPTDYHLSYPITECGTNLQVSAQGVQFGISIWTWEGEYEGSGQSSIITRGEWQNIRVFCTIPTSQNLTASFLPVAPVNEEYLPREVAVEGMGSFTLYLEFYRTSNFTNAYGLNDYPLEVTLNQNIFFKLGAIGRGGLVLLTEQCIAMSTPTLTPTTLTYYFIRGGCMVDPTVQNYSSSNQLENLFSIQAFQFQDKLLDRREDSTIYIQCQILLCDSSANTRCTQGCLPSSSRRKRDTEKIEIIEEEFEEENEQHENPLDILESPPQKVASLIILIVPAGDGAPDPTNAVDYEDKDDQKEIRESDKTSLILGVTTGVSLALVIFVVAFYFLRIRKGSKGNATNVKI